MYKIYTLKQFGFQNQNIKCSEYKNSHIWAFCSVKSVPCQRSRVFVCGCASLNANVCVAVWISTLKKYCHLQLPYQ